MHSQVAVNKARGAQFEAVLSARARLYGMLALKNELSFRYKRGGAITPIRADLDFRILAGDGRVAFVDAKVRERDFFTISEINADQRKRSLMYCHFNVTSGFVVLFAALDRVVFFDGAQLAGTQQTRMRPAMGVDLGQLATMDLRKIFRPLSHKALR